MEGTNLSSAKPVPSHQTRQTGGADTAYSSGVRLKANKLEAEEKTNEMGGMSDTACRT